jgi:cell division protease FtsH
VISDETARIIDEEVRRIIDAAKARAMALLKRDMDVLHALAAALIERETLSGDEIRRIAGAAPGEMPNV